MEFPDKTQQPIHPVVKKDIKPVVNGKQAKRPATRRFFDYLFAESPKELAQKVGRDVLVPRMKASFFDACHSFINGMSGDSMGSYMPSNVKTTVLRAGGTNYNAMSTQPSALNQAREANISRTSSGNYQDIICPDQATAELLLANMFELFNQYRVVTVADLYELANITPQISDNAYGWTSLDGSRIRTVSTGVLLELPRPHVI